MAAARGASDRTAGAAAAAAGTRPPVLPLRHPLETGRCGAKATTLARMAAAGLPVPDGFVVTVPACAAWSADPVPDDVRAAVAEALTALGDGPVAVRSSACAEDQPAESYAGQYATVLDVPATDVDAVCAAVGEVVASATGERVRRYHGGHHAGGMAVLVQRQVRAEAAGVAFSADPVTGDRDRAVVSAVRGLGTRLVDGTATPQQWTVRAGASTCTAPGAGTDEGALTADDAARVAALTKRVAALAGAPQDVEWAIEGGRLWLLQARPITALPVPPPVRLPAGSWVKETGRRADPVTPLGASLALPLVTETMAAAFAGCGALLDRIEMRAVGGEVYARAVPVGGHDGAPPPWPVLGLLARLAPPLRARVRAARQAVRSGGLDEAPRCWQHEWRPQLVAAMGRLRAVDPGALSDDELDAHLGATVALLRTGLGMHFRLVPPYALAVHRLVRCCRDLLGWDAAAALELLAGLSEATVEPVRDLAAVAARVAGSPAAVAALDRGDGDPRPALRAADPAAGAAFDAWCDRYGWRAAGDDVGPTLDEAPHLLAGLLRAAVAQRGTSGGEAGRRREEATARAHALLATRGAADRRRFDEVLAAAARVYPTREDSALTGGAHPVGLVRRAALEIGRRLVHRGALDRADDAVWLDLDALRAALRGTGAPPRPAVARARAEYAWVAAHPGPAWYGRPPSPPPDVRALPRPAREVNAALLWAQAAQRRVAPPDPDPDGVLTGAPASAGRYTGPARVVRGFADADRVRPGDVLVCPTTSPAWSVLFGRVGAIVTDAGGALSHAGIVAREYAIPAVLGTGVATAAIRDGQEVTVDGGAGRVTLREPSTAPAEPCRAPPRPAPARLRPQPGPPTHPAHREEHRP